MQLIYEHGSEGDTVVYTGSCVLGGDRSYCGFSDRIRNEVVAVNGLVQCPSHAGMKGNERADQLTSIAPVAGTVGMDKIENFKKISYRILINDKRTSQLVEMRRSELGIKCAFNRRGCLKGLIRQIYNQLGTGTVSIYILPHLLW